jgi:hypothetical protein
MRRSTHVSFLLGNQILILDAIVRGGLALHRTLIYDTTSYRWKVGRAWQITHIASRRVLVMQLPVGYPQGVPPYPARRLLARLARCGNWHTLSPAETVLTQAVLLIARHRAKDQRLKRFGPQFQRQSLRALPTRDGALILNRKLRRDLAKLLRIWPKTRRW